VRTKKLTAEEKKDCTKELKERRWAINLIVRKSSTGASLKESKNAFAKLVPWKWNTN